MRPTRQPVRELDIDATAKELLAPLGKSKTLKVDDVGAIAAREDAATPQVEFAPDDTCEIELTVEQMDAMLKGT